MNIRLRLLTTEERLAHTGPVLMVSASSSTQMINIKAGILEYFAGSAWENGEWRDVPIVEAK